MIEQFALNFILTLTRCAAFVAFAPQFGDRELPRQIKVGMAMALTFFWFNPLRPLDQSLIPASGEIQAVGLFLIVFRELLLGATIGFLFQLLLLPARIAGSYIGQEMGLSMAMVADPSSPGGTTLISRVLEVFAILLFLSLDVHHLMLAGLNGAFQLVPIGAEFEPRRWEIVFTHFAQMNSQGLLLAAPIGACLFVMSAALALLTRATPQLNLFSIGFPLRILAGLIGLAIFLPQLIHLMTGTFGQAHGLVLELIR